jgi:hypothetical protein
MTKARVGENRKREKYYLKGSFMPCLQIVILGSERGG